MTKLLIINGPNLNLLGSREKKIYGETSFEQFFENFKQAYPAIDLGYFQSNVEGEIINKLQAANGKYNGVIINPAGYSHTSVAIADAIAAIQTPVVEVHISNIAARENFRHATLTGAKCAGVISGFGLNSYRLAVEYFMKGS